MQLKLKPFVDDKTKPVLPNLKSKMVTNAKHIHSNPKAQNIVEAIDRRQSKSKNADEGKSQMPTQRQKIKIKASYCLPHSQKS